MREATRERLRKFLSPRAYHFTHYFWWQVRYCLPRQIGSAFVDQSPQVSDFSAERGGELVEQIRRVSLVRSTKLGRIMTWHGSDKGHVRHNYTAVYSALFKEWRNRPLRIFELGLGTNNPMLVSSMGEMGRPGASLHGWREFFPHALIFGADIDRDILFESKRIWTFYCDQLDPVAIRDLWSQPALRGGMDILIDDGLHTFEGNISFLNGSLDRLRPGGIYVIEDILQETVRRWRDYLQETCPCLPGFEFVFAELPNPFNHYDNNLLIIRRRL
jgi:hypothetical protein